MPAKFLKNKFSLALTFSFLGLVFFTNQANACSAPSLTITKNDLNLSVSITYKATDSQGLGAISLSSSIATKNPIDALTCANGNSFPTTCSSSWSGNFNSGTTVKFTASASCKDFSHTESSQTVVFPAAQTTTTTTTTTIPTCSGPTSQACTPKLPNNAVSCSASTQDRVCANGKWGDWTECKATFCLCLSPNYKWDEATKSCVATNAPIISPREELKARLALWVFPSSDIDKLINFTILKGVPFDEANAILTTALNMPNSDPFLYLQTYGIVYDAVNNNLIDDKYKPILDYLKNGQIDVNKGDITSGYAGMYYPLKDGFLFSSKVIGKMINANDIDSQGIAIHELVHAHQDATKDTRPLQELEVDAYLTEGKHALLMSGLIKKADGGFTFNDSKGYYDLTGNGKTGIPDAFRTLLITETAMINAQNGKNELNNVSITTADGSDKLLSGMSSDEVFMLTSARSAFLRESVLEQWRKATKNSSWINAYLVRDRVFYDSVAEDPTNESNGLVGGTIK